MDEGFLVRVVAQSERESRNVVELAAAVRREGLDAHAVMLVRISLQLSQMSERADVMSLSQIAEHAHDIHRGLRHAAMQMHAASGGVGGGAPVRLARIACELEKCAKVVAKINYDALGETQPIWPVPRR